jgi:hypothetical protein
MPDHRFSIVIPTRERPRTLAFCLRTCLVQQHDDFEVVVSDNHSSPATREVVESLASPRLKYVRTPGPLAMTDSFEFAIAQAKGEFILMLGDDDGLLPHALPEIDRIIQMVDARALRWESVVYHWPDFAPQAQAKPDRLLLPLKLVNHHHAVRPVASAKMIRAAANLEVEYSRLPMSYCSSAVHHSLCDELRRRTGRVFRSESPDVYSAFAFASLVDPFHSVNAPMSICGLSGHSNGVACLQQVGGSPIATEFRKLNAAAGHLFHPRIPFLSSLPACVADSFQHAKDALFPHDDTLAVDRRRLVTNCLRARPPRDEEEWGGFVAACRQAFADDGALLSWFEAEYASQPFRPATPANQEDGLKRYGGDYLYLDTRDFGVSDVFGAAELCERILGYRRHGVNVRPEAAAEDDSSSLSELQQKEEIIRGLAAGVTERDKSIQMFIRMVNDRDEYTAKLEHRLGELEAWHVRWSRPLRRGLPHLFGKVVQRLVGPRRKDPAA